MKSYNVITKSLKVVLLWIISSKMIDYVWIANLPRLALGLGRGSPSQTCPLPSPLLWNDWSGNKLVLVIVHWISYIINLFAQCHFFPCPCFYWIHHCAACGHYHWKHVCALLQIYISNFQYYCLQCILLGLLTILAIYYFWNILLGLLTWIWILDTI